jgi:DNA-binding transcriptional regulator YiaG
VPRPQIHESLDDLPDPATRRALRAYAGIPAYKLATRIGVAPSSVHAWERGDREPTGLQRRAYRRALRRLAEHFPSEEGSRWPSDS